MSTPKPIDMKKSFALQHCPFFLRHSRFILLLAAPLLASAQPQSKTAPCSQEELMTVKGKWVKGPEDHIITGRSFPEVQIKEMGLRIDQACRLIRAAWPDPKGMLVKWYRSLGFTVPGRSGTFGYDLTGMAFHYYCNPDLQHLGVDDENDGGFTVHFNTFGSLLSYDTSMHVGRYYVALMAPRVGKLKEADLYQTSLIRANEQFVIIARDGQFPLKMLTRKEYLTSLRSKLQREKAKFIDNGIKYAKTDQQKEQARTYWQSHYDAQLKPIDEYLSRASGDDLDQTAFIKDLQNFTRFYTEAEGGRTPVINNTNYFRPQQTPYFPQFIIVFWNWNDGEGMAGGLLRPHAPDLNVCCRVDKFFKESMEQNLDVAAFRDLLDK